MAILFSACVSYSVMHVFVCLLEQYDVTYVFRVLFLSRMIVTSFFSFYFSSGTLLFYYFFSLTRIVLHFCLFLFPNKLRKFQFCGGEWRIGSLKSGDLEKKVKNPWCRSMFRVQSTSGFVFIGNSLRLSFLASPFDIVTEQILSFVIFKCMS